MHEDLLLSSYHYQLPEKLIAQSPANPRDSSRLLVVNSLNCHVHSNFYSLADWLHSGDLLVLNNTKVIPARLYGTKTTGAPVEILLLEEKKPNCWLALVKPGKRFKQDAEIIFKPSDNQWQENWQLKAKVVEKDEITGGRILEFALPPNKFLWEFLDRFGEIPLPPYISSDPLNYRDRYQTVFASELGAVAAPTAGLHFTEELLQKLQQQGIETTYITLHVGVGTFRPVETNHIVDHAMHQEWIEVNAQTIAKILETKARGGRVIAIGTTATRALEGAVKETKSKSIEPFRGKTDLFIYPGYQWQIVDGLITNFHLPGSSLLMLVSALIGRQRLLDLYQNAIAEKYRFYSFGDAMLILPAAKIN